MDSTIIAAIITGVAILLAAIIPILRNKPGQKKLTRARLSIWGITALAVGAIWLLPYFYINRDIVGNKTMDILNVLIERRDRLADIIKNVQIEYIITSENAAVAEAERQRNGNIQKRYVIVTKELIEKSKLAKGDMLYGENSMESNPLFSYISDQNIQAGTKIELPAYDPNVEASAQMGRRDALYNVLKELREQVKAIDEQITAIASSKAR